MKKFSLFNAIKHDYALLGAIIFSVMLFGLSIYDSMRFNVSLLNLFTAISVIFLLLGISRIFVIHSYFSNYEIIEGMIVKIRFYKDRGRVTFVYLIDGVAYQRGLAIMKTKLTKEFYEKHKIEVIVKKSNPKKSLIAILYTH